MFHNFLVGIGVIVVIAAASAIYTSIRTQSINEEFPAQGAFVEVDGIKLHYIDSGPRSGALPAIVIVHGASSNLRDLRHAFSDHLTDRFRVIILDRPGFGWSGRHTGYAHGSPGQQAELVHKAVAKIGVGAHVLVGHSWAGALVLAYGLNNPGNLKGIVALAPVSHPWPGGIAWYYSLTSAPFVGAVFSATVMLPLAELQLQRAVKSVFHPQEPPEGYAKEAGVDLILRPQSFRANAVDVSNLFDFVSKQSTRYGEMTVPLTVISGSLDTIVSSDIHSRALERQVPGARVIILDGVGHMPHYVEPDLVIAEIEALAMSKSLRRARSKNQSDTASF